MNNGLQPEADLFLYPSALSAGLLNDQRNIAARRAKQRLSRWNFFMALPLGLAAIWGLGSTTFQLGCFAGTLLFTLNAMRLHLSQRKTLTLQRQSRKR